MYKYYKTLLLFFGLVIITFIHLGSSPCPGNADKREPHAISDSEVAVIDHYESDTGYYIFYRPDLIHEKPRILVFTHGYGALNPSIFGAWLQHILAQGLVIVYPRYQNNLISPFPSAFTSNVVTALHRARVELETRDISFEDVYYLGHSFGGVITANIVAQYQQFDLPKPKGLLIAEGGVGPFDDVILDTYSPIDEDIPLLIVVGDKDWTVGDFFGLKVFGDTKQLASVHLIRQKEYLMMDSTRLTASHYEPYAYDEWCENGLNNLTYKRALKVGKVDVLDKNGYWIWLDMLMGNSPICTDDLMMPLRTVLGDDVSEVLEVLTHNTTPISKRED